MKTFLSRAMKVGLAAFTLYLGVIADVHAGGASLLHLPIEGVTAENRAQCAKLFEKKFGPVLIDWKEGDVKMIKDASTDLVVLRPDRGQISLSDVERALTGSDFSINREHLKYFSLIRLRIGKIADYEKHVKALAALDGKKLQSDSVENADGSLWITLRDPKRNTATTWAEKGKRSLLTHQRLTRYLFDNKIDLIEISWGYRPKLDDSKAWRYGAGTMPDIWRGDSFGARSDATAGEGEQDGARQPTAAPDSKSEGNDKPELETEGRSQ